VGLGRRDWVWGALYGGNGIILTPGILLEAYTCTVLWTTHSSFCAAEAKTHKHAQAHTLREEINKSVSPWYELGSARDTCYEKKQTSPSRRGTNWALLGTHVTRRNNQVRLAVVRTGLCSGHTLREETTKSVSPLYELGSARYTRERNLKTRYIF